MKILLQTSEHPRTLHARPFRSAAFLVALACLLLATPLALAAAKPFVHPLFSNNMVLQRDVQNPVWGWTTPGANVSVTINSVTYPTTAGADGRWQVLLNALGAGGPYTMAVSGPQSQTLTNIMVGDVYLCSGQSNMARTLKATEAGQNNDVVNYSTEVADSLNYTAKIRVFTVASGAANSPQEVPPGGLWLAPSSANTPNFSAAGYFTAREINKQQNIPIGLIVSAIGGTDIKWWSDPAFVSAFPDTAQESYDQTGLAATTSSISALYNAMLAPLAPFKIKGVLWDQGSQNKLAPDQYARLLSGFRSSIRTLFDSPNLPFLIIQLSNYGTPQTLPVETTISWPGIREAQLDTARGDANSAIITTIDLGEAANIHPRNRQDVGLRAANVAAALIYGQTAAPTNAIGPEPVYSHSVVSGNTIRCYFENVGGGLMAGSKPTVLWNGVNISSPLAPIQEQPGSALTGFAICGADGVFYTANATIDPGGDSVVVSSPSVPNPVAMRFLWGTNPPSNLYRKVLDSSGNVVNGIPVSPFRTDPSYILVVNRGSGGGTYPLGGTAGITATSLPGQVFDHWSGDTGFLSSTTSPSATATIGQRYVTVLANYRITGAPAGLTASPAISRVTLSWSAMTAVHYSIKRATSPGGPFTTVASNLTGVTQYDDRTVSNGTTYYYVISAVNALGEGPDSATVSATLVPVVDNVAAADSAGRVALTWSAFNGTASSYNIKRATAANGPYNTIATVSGNTTSFTDWNVVSGDVFYYVITAVHSGGETVNSLPLHVVPTFIPPPLAAADVGVTGFRGGVYSTASGSYSVVGSGSGIGGTEDSFHFVYARLSGNGTITARIATPGSSASKVGVMMRASLDAGSASASVVSNTALARCELRTATDGTTSISNSNAGVNATTYPWVRIVRTGNVFAGYVSPDGTTWTSIYFNPPAIPMADPIYVGLAVSACDNSTTTTAVFDNLTITGFTPAVPPAPAGLSVSQTFGAAQATLRWQSAAAAAGYNVKRAAASGGPYTTVASGLNALSYECTNLSAGSTYYYCIAATDQAGESPNSNEVAVDLTPPAITVPADIVSYATAASGASITFSTSAADNISGPLATTNNPASGSLFPIGTTTVTASATDALGNTSSRTFSVTVDVPPPSSFAAAALSESQFLLTWSNNAPFGTGYILQRSPHGQNTWTTLGGSFAANATSYTDSLLSPSSSYDYRLQRLMPGFASSFATLNAATPAGAGDGIPGSWRLEYFGDGLSAGGNSAASADPDGDGQSNQKEYLAGTSPVDPASVLRASIGQTGNTMIISFSSVSGKSYRLEQAAELGAGANWQPLQQNVPGTGGTVELGIPDSGSQPRRFFRIVVE